jgi:hypothetical protein
MPVQWKSISQKQFDALPENRPPSQVDPEWEELLTALDQGKVVEIPYTDERDRRGKRLAVGRRAAGKGFKVTIRYDGANNAIAVKKSDEPLPPREGKTSTNGRRRRRTPDETAQELDREDLYAEAE